MRWPSAEYIGIHDLTKMCARSGSSTKAGTRDGVAEPSASAASHILATDEPILEAKKAEARWRLPVFW